MSFHLESYFPAVTANSSYILLYKGSTWFQGFFGIFYLGNCKASCVKDVIKVEWIHVVKPADHAPCKYLSYLTEWTRLTKYPFIIPVLQRCRRVDGRRVFICGIVRVTVEREVVNTLECRAEWDAEKCSIFVKPGHAKGVSEEQKRCEGEKHLPDMVSFRIGRDCYFMPGLLSSKNLAISWEEANKSCEAMNTTLATFPNIYTMEAAKTQISHVLDLTIRPVFIGLCEEVNNFFMAPNLLVFL